MYIQVFGYIIIIYFYDVLQSMRSQKWQYHEAGAVIA